MTFVDIAAWSTQRYNIALARVVGDKDADVWELLAYLADTRALRSNDQPV